MIECTIKPRAAKFLRNMNKKLAMQIISSINRLSHDPLPHDSKKLVGYENTYRIDTGEYRVIYKVWKVMLQDRIIVDIVLIGKRNDSEVYKQLKRM